MRLISALELPFMTEIQGRKVPMSKQINRLDQLCIPLSYLWKNRRRMNYAAYRKAGLPISSGAVESAAKTLVQQRMKQAGMRWPRDGAQAMLTLRARLLSDRWHEIPI